MKERLEQYARDFQARQAAREQLPSWVKAILLPTALLSIFGLMAGFVFAALYVHASLHPGLARNQNVVAIIFVSSLVTAIAPGLIFANYALWLVPGARRALNRNAISVPGGSFRSANDSLLKVARFTVPVGLIPLAVATIYPWS